MRQRLREYNQEACRLYRWRKKCDVNFEKALMTVEYDESKLNDKLIVKKLTENTTYSLKSKKQCTSSSSCSTKCSKKTEPKKGIFQKVLGWF